MSLPDPIEASPAPWRQDAMAAVLEAVAGLRNRRALLALMSCLFIGVLVSGLAGRMGFAGAVFGAIAFLVAAATGVNAAGLLQLDGARGAPLRSITDALVYGVMCIPKVLALALILLAVEFALLVGVALVFVICKLPLVGPLLYLVAFPIAVVVAGLTLFGLFLCFVIALPALWDGRSVLRAIAQAGAVAHARPIETLLLLALLALLCVAVGVFIGAIIGAGLVPAVALSAALLGEGGLSGFESLLTIAQGYGGATYMVAALLGGGLLWALAVALIGQVYLRGLNIIYLRVTEGLDVDGAEAALANRLGDARRRAAALGDRARAAAVPDRNPAPPAFTAPTPASFAPPDDDATVASRPVPAAAVASASTSPIASPPTLPPAPTSAVQSLPTLAPAPPSAFESPETVVMTLSCPKCAARCAPQDVFCGVCGQRLR
jgi:hypothetical protein